MPLGLWIYLSFAAVLGVLVLIRVGQIIWDEFR